MYKLNNSASSHSHPQKVTEPQTTPKPQETKNETSPQLRPQLTELERYDNKFSARYLNRIRSQFVNQYASVSLARAGSIGDFAVINIQEGRSVSRREERSRGERCRSARFFAERLRKEDPRRNRGG